MNEIIANIHIHTSYSDGTKLQKEIIQIAGRCGLDAVIITDHNIYVKGLDGYFSVDGKNVLLLTGEEIHDKNRIPQKNHLLAIGVDRSYVKFASDPQKLIDQINENNGATFIAHAHDPELPAFGEDDLSWEDWSVTGFTGMEIWNNLSEIKFHVKNKVQAVFLAFFPQFLAVQPPKTILERWDSLLSSGQRVVGIGGSDAHTMIYNIGPFTKEVFPYRYHFKTINTHILLASAISGSAKEDSRMVVDALKAGRAFVANDSIKPSHGFRFYAQVGNSIYQMGSQCAQAEDPILKAELPFQADCSLIRNGKPIAYFKNARQFDFPIQTAGFYRLECYRNHLFKKRGWIFSNPIFVK